jgi:periplasmic copper chaperone A
MYAHIAYTRAVRRIIQPRCGAALLVLWFIAQTPVLAVDYRAGDMVVAHPWSRPTPPVASVGAVYFTMTNFGPKADRLIAISTPVAGKVQIHESRKVQGMVQMRAVTSIECLPGQTVKSEPGGLHVMLLDLTHPLAAGAQFPLMMRFRDAGTVTVLVRVGAPE